MWTKATRKAETNSILWSISYEYRTVIQATEQLTGFVRDSVIYMSQDNPQQKPRSLGTV